jgi:hypothetical protein
MGTCSALPGAGTACAFGMGGICAQDSYCNAQGQCVASVAVGMTCQDSGQCIGNGQNECVGPTGNAKCGTFTWMMCN